MRALPTREARLKRIVEMAGRELEWNQPHATQRQFVLVAAGETLATLEFRSMLGSLATAETADGTWTFKRVGFWKPSVTVRAADSEAEVATFRNNTWSAGGTLELPDGRRYPANSNFWMTSFEFKNENQETLVRYTRMRGVFHRAASVEIGAAGARLAELPWLVALGWYLSIMMQDDASGAAAAAAAG
jgi:hypothetical protein